MDITGNRLKDFKPFSFVGLKSFWGNGKSAEAWTFPCQIFTTLFNQVAGA